MSVIANTPSVSPWWQRPSWLASIALLATLALLCTESIVTLAITLMEGIPAVAAITLSSLSGVWIVRGARLTADRRADRLIVGSALGVGLLASIVLLLGSMGALSRTSAFACVGGLSILGLTALLRELSSPTRTPSEPEHRGLNWLWLLVTPFLAITMAAACLPPGVLWKDEGFGYDVLEYHLAVPKAFATTGHIQFLPNNVYSNFPLNSEMLSLLMMQLRGNAIEAAFMAVFVNVALASLFVAAAWWAGSAFGRASGVISGVAAATVPWLAYLSGIAYVEADMLATGMAALGLLLHAAKQGDSRWRPVFTAGLLAGISCGFKYTAIPMIAVPLVIILCFGSGAARVRFQRITLFVIGCGVTFSPWMIRNVINTGNPIFPLGYSVFGSRPGLWDRDMQAVWDHAHGSSEAEHNLAPVWQRAIERTFAEPLMGPIVFLLAALGVIRRRDRWTLALLLILLWQILFWLTFTHLFARFVVVMLLPLAVLAGRSIEALGGNEADSKLKPQHLLLAVLFLGAATNLYRLGRLYYDHTRVAGHRLDASGHTEWFTRGEWPGTAHWGAINALPAGSRVTLVGEARTFYLLTPCEYAVIFNRHPLAEEVQNNEDAKAVLRWMRKRGTTHLLAHWGEMGRLATTYGFYADLTPELFKRLEEAGLKHLGEYKMREGEPPYATLYEVPRHE